MSRNSFRAFDSEAVGVFLFSFVLVLSSLASTFGYDVAAEQALYNARLIPAPNFVEYNSDVVVFNDNLRCEIVLPDEFFNESTEQIDAATQLTRKFFAKYYNAQIKVECKSLASAFEAAQKTEGADEKEKKFLAKLDASKDKFFAASNATSMLTLADASTSGDVAPSDIMNRRETAQGKLIIASSDVAGVRDALKTLRQLAEAFGDSNSAKLSRSFVPGLELYDQPALSFRGIHLCWFPETDLSRIEQAIRIAAYYKFNYAVIEFWGTFPFQNHPELYWDQYHTTKEDVKRLVALGKELGIELIPQMNLFGHATEARVSVGKHTTLDRYPDFEPLFEPDGWTWNVLNPEARKTLAECVVELYETFDSPKFFHIGCDEAYSSGSSFLARRSGDYVDKLADWLVFFHDLLKERDCRMMMWHDMLISGADFGGYVVGANATTKGLIDKLPKDVLICDWQYGKPKEKETWPTSEYFGSKGFEVVSCPWRETSGIISLGKNAAEKRYFGLLCTTWHHFYGEDMRNILTLGAQATWGTPYRGSGFDKQRAVNRHLQQINNEIKNRKYEDGGVDKYQVIKDTNGPQG